MSLPRYEELLDVLYEDNHCLAVNKPSGWPTAHYDGQTDTVDRYVKDYIREKYNKPGEVYLGVVHRIDKPVSGALLFARTSKAAARLSEQFRNGAIEKVYWAVVDGEVKQTFGTLEDWLRKNEALEKVEVVEEGEPGARLSLMHFTTKAVHGGRTLLELRPQTGRKHQLRVQLAHAGFPIHGDAKYGSAFHFGNAIGLHARSLTFLHPTKHEPITLTAEVPQPWRGRFAYLFKGGEK